MATIQDIADRLGVSKGTVSKALNGAPDISETLQKTILETAVEMGYTRIRRKDSRKLCILTENLEYQEPHQFGYEIILGFRQMAEPAGYRVEIVDVSERLQKSVPYDVFMMKHDYPGAFVLGFSLSDPWMKDFETARTPAVLYDNYIMTNPRMAYVGIDNNEGMELTVSRLKALGHRKIGYLSGALGSHIMQVRHSAFFHAMRQNGLKADPALTGSSLYVYLLVSGKAASPPAGAGRDGHRLQPRPAGERPSWSSASSSDCASPQTSASRASTTCPCAPTPPRR